MVQRHRATALHYDLRLELGGVLLSWAVPKGPTRDAAVRRLAVRTDDHDLTHLDVEARFEPSPSGAPRDTLVWDRGHWRPEPGSEAAGVAAGRLVFALAGHKLVGGFVLRRTGTERGREQWLLLKRHDADAVAGWDPEAHPRSVLSGRTNDELGDDEELTAIEIEEHLLWRGGGQRTDGGGSPVRRGDGTRSH